MSAWNVKLVDDSESFDKAMKIRFAVFVHEQGVDPALEHDGLDKTSAHVLSFDGEEPCGTARVFEDPEHPNTYWIGRVAVLAPARGKGCGHAIMEYLLKWCQNMGAKEVHLHAQEKVVPIYERHGFQKSGERFLEAGIWHLHMWRPL